MLLLLSSLAAAQTTIHVGETSEVTTIYAALQVLGEGQAGELILEADYNGWDDGNFPEMTQGIQITQDLVIRSSEEGSLRAAPPLYISDGAKVTLQDLDLSPCKSAASYANPFTSDATWPYACLRVGSGAEVNAQNIEISGVDVSGGQQALVHVTDANLSLSQSRFRDNIIEESIAYDNGTLYSMTYGISLLVEGTSDRVLTLKDVTLEQSGGVLAYGTGAKAGLDIEGGLISGVTQSYYAGSAVWVAGGGNSEVNGLQIEDARDTAVRLVGGSHWWNDLDVGAVIGGFGGAFYTQSGASLQIGGRISGATAEKGGLVYADADSGALQLKGLTADGVTAPYGGVVYSQGGPVEIQGSRFCDIKSSAGPMFDVGNNLVMENTVVRSSLGSSFAVAGEVKAINNTFVDLEGDLVAEAPVLLRFINNAVVRVESLRDDGIPAQLELHHNLFDGLTNPLTSTLLGRGEENIVDTDPEFVAAFEADTTDCSIDPEPAVGSPLVDAGDPTIVDPDGSISDIGAFGGPNAESWLSGDDTGGPSVIAEDAVTLMGGCGQAGGSAALLLVPLLLLGRRRYSSP